MRSTQEKLVQGPVIDLVLMMLIILFFGMKQHDRPQQYYRSWLLGWICVLCSFVTFEISDGWLQHLGLVWGPIAVTGRELLRLDLMILAGMIFALSFPRPDTQGKRHYLLPGMLFAVFCVVVNAQILGAAGGWFWPFLLVVGEGLTGYIFWTRLPKDWRAQRVLHPGLCCIWTLAGLVALHNVSTPYSAAAPDYVLSVLLAQFFLSAGLLHGTVSQARRLVRLTTVAGFVIWALFYPLGDALHNWPAALHLLYEFWQVPKYAVGFGMILEIFDASEVEVRLLAESYRLLYEDFRELYENHPHPMWISVFETQRCVSVNAAALRDFGYSEAEFLGFKTAELELPRDEEQEAVDSMLAPSPQGRRTRLLLKDGNSTWVNLQESGILFGGRPARLVMARDITAQLSKTRELAHRANHDELTGLPNRTLLWDRVEQCLQRSVREQCGAVMFAIDVDHFKMVNDTYGHQAGDSVLKLVAARLQSRIRRVDTLARTGGEEFTAIIGGLKDNAAAERIGEMLRESFAEPLEVPELDHPLTLTISLGAAIFPDDSTEAESLWRLADEALYEAKRGGRNCLRFAKASVPA